MAITRTNAQRITPALAKEWLGFNTHNRDLSKRHVSRLATDMKNGKFVFTGDPIRFNGDGGLIDGQHRLHACVEAGVPFESDVIRGFPLSTQEMLDQGRSRTAGDHLNLRGIKAGMHVAAAARQLYRLACMSDGVESLSRALTNAEVLAMVDKHPGLIESVAAVGQPREGHGAIGFQPSLLAAIHYVVSVILKDREKADAFISVLENGGTEADDPAHLWRERVSRSVIDNATMRRATLRRGTVHALNLFLRGEKIKRFQLPDSARIEGLASDMI